MATAKTGSERRSSTQSPEAFYLKQRVQELEREVQDYKRRLDELRKAKNQTILKREREILEVASPFQRRNSENSVGIKNTKENKDNENQNSNLLIDKLKSTHADEVEKLKDRIEQLELENKNKPKEVPPCDHLEQIQQLSSALETVENERDAYRYERGQFEERLKQVVNELSIKEASWCQREEELTKNLNSTFSAKYQAWMSQTESKIRDLQDANSQLRTLLEGHRPTGPDPTGQDRK